MAKIQQVVKCHLGGTAYETVEQVIAVAIEHQPQDESIMSLETVGMITATTELLENGTVLKTTRVFENQSVYDLWLQHWANNRKSAIEEGLGWTLVEAPIVTQI